MGLLLLSVGILAGGYGTIVGAGGGFIFVPALLLIFHMDPAIASSTGLIIVLINSLSGVLGYARKKMINYKIGLTVGISALPGSVIGVWLLHSYTSKYFYVVFATILVLLGIFLLKNNSKNLNSNSYSQEKSSINSSPVSKGNTKLIKKKWFIPIGIIMGLLSSYLGIGGGWLLVPILIYLFMLPTHQATATSIFTLCLYTSVGVITQFFYNSIDWWAVMWGGAGVVIGAQFGVILSQRIPGKLIIQMLSILVIVIGVRLYFN